MPKKGQKQTPEARAKISATKRRNPHHLRGKHHTPETREKMSKAHKGKTLSSETRAKIAAYHRGLKHDPATCEKMSISALNRDPTTRHVAGRFSKAVDWAGREVVFQSSIERNYFFARVSQGVRIRDYCPDLDGEYVYVFKGKSHRYIPDFIEECGGIKRVIEIKPYGLLEDLVSYENKRWPGKGDRTRAKFQAFPEVFLIDGSRYPKAPA